MATVRGPKEWNGRGLGAGRTCGGGGNHTYWSGAQGCLCVILILLLMEVCVHVATDLAGYGTIDFIISTHSSRFRKESGKEGQKGPKEDRPHCVCNFFI